jgi:hypothetical protein
MPDGWLEVNLHPEGPATGELYRFRQKVISGRKSHKGAQYQDVLTD